MERPRIYADFNGLQGSPRGDSRQCVPLDTWGSLRDLSTLGVSLSDGMRLVISSDSDEHEDLEADAVAFYNSEQGWWFAEIEGEIRDVPHREWSTTFLCLGCRADLGPTADTRTRNEQCPHCGVSIQAAIAPPK
jgi:DNA-directed RNA polymerase subunit RPC12/RpoP